jgi:serine/threonine protein kinase
MVGQLLDNRYRLTKLLGIGGMGKVYLAQHTDTQLAFAIKLMHDDLLRDEGALQRFEREARALNSIDHPHIVEVYDYGQTQDGVPFLVMEYLQGTTLRVCLDNLQSEGLPLAQVVNIAIQAALALQHVHEKGIIHRDIKPDNLQLTLLHDRAVFVKLFDFGIARIQSQTGVTAIRQPPPATLAYAAPEIHLSANYLSPAIDVYALGVTLFEMITKQRPFPGSGYEVVWAHMKETPRKLSQCRQDIKIPGQLDELTEQMLAKDPAQRPSMGEIVERLRELGPIIQAASAPNLHSLRTFVLPNQQRGSRSEKAPGAPGRKDAPSALELLSSGRDIDQIETEREQLSLQLQEECEKFIRRYFTEDVAAELAEAINRCEVIEQTKSELELDLALLNDALSQEQMESQARRNKLRHELQVQRDALRACSLTANDSRHELVEELARIERAYAASEKASATMLRLQQEGIRHQQLRAELLDAQQELGLKLLHVATENLKYNPGKPDNRDEQRLSKLVTRLNERLAQLTSLKGMLQQA